MKRFIPWILCLFFMAASNLYSQNISTGITDGGSSIPIGGADPNWRIIASPAGPVAALHTTSITGFWQPTPIAGTNAGWINSAGIACANTPGNYTFERSFTISGSLTTFTANFKVAYDDNLLSLQLINPAGSSIPLSVTPTSPYMLSSPVIHTENTPMAGTWRIRAVVQIVNDQTQCGAFMLSGEIATSCEPLCLCETLNPTFTGGVNKCTGEFTSTTKFPACMNTPVPPAYGWFVDGAWVGVGPTLNYTFPGNSVYHVCLRVFLTLPNGETCLREVCQDIAVNDCDCLCETLQPSFSTTIEKCEGTFLSTTEIPSCMEATGTVNYNWTVNGTLAGSGSSFNYTFPGNGTYAVCLTVTTLLPGGNECVKEVCNDVEVTDCIPCNCDAIVPVIHYNVDKCNLTLNGSAVLPPCLQGTNVAYNWFVNSVYVGSGANLMYSLPDNGIYTLCMEAGVVWADGTKCTKQTCVEIIANNCGACKCKNVIPAFTYTVANCVGHFVNTSTGPACINLAYEWYVNGTLAATGSTFDYPFPGSGVYNVCLKVVGSMPGDVPCKPSICKDITVNCAPCNCTDLNPDFQSIINQCNGTFTSNGQVPSCLLNVTYDWLVDGNPAGSGTTLNYAFTGTGAYNVCLRISGTTSGPGGGPCVREVCYTVYVSECTNTCSCSDIVANFNGGANRCDGIFISESVVPACMQNVSYNWYVNYAPAGTGTTFNYTFSSSGTYDICLMIMAYLPDGTYCERMVCKQVTVDCPLFFNPQGNETSSSFKDESLLLYPNPASDELNIEFELKEANDVNISLKSMDGKELLTEKRMAEAGRQHFNLKIPSSVANSMIFLELTVGKEKTTRIVSISKP